MFNTVLFDVDGVLLSEERYFDASALTVWELLMSSNYLGLDQDSFQTSLLDTQISTIRRDVFDDDQVLKVLKSKGINANWDMVYLTFSHQLIHLVSQLPANEREQASNLLKKDIDRESLRALGEILGRNTVKPNFTTFFNDFSETKAEKQTLFNHLNVLVKMHLGIETTIFSRNSTLWDIGRVAFQEWYLGEEKTLEASSDPLNQAGKEGFLHNEIPIVDPKAMKEIFQAIKAKGTDIGIGTGRPEQETKEPLEHIGILPLVNYDQIVSASDVLKAEQHFPDEVPLAKPQPFTFVYAYLGRDTKVKEVIDKPLPIPNSEDVLVVGDSIADLMAARAAGFSFAAVLTGLSGKKARASFESREADYIFNDISELVSLFK